MKNLTRIAVLGLTVILAAAAFSQRQALPAPYDKAPAWTVSAPTTLTITKASGQSATGNFLVTSSDLDTFLYQQSSAPYFYLQADQCNHLDVNNVFVVGTNISGVTATVNTGLSFNSANYGYGWVDIFVPSSYSGSGFDVEYLATDAVLDPIKDTTQEKTLVVTVVHN